MPRCLEQYTRFQSLPGNAVRQCSGRIVVSTDACCARDSGLLALRLSAEVAPRLTVEEDYPGGDCVAALQANKMSTHELSSGFEMNVFRRNDASNDPPKRRRGSSNEAARSAVQVDVNALGQQLQR
eukprot:11245-Heterococcus_DN1.PRE.1